MEEREPNFHKDEIRIRITVREIVSFLVGFLMGVCC